MLRYLLAKIKNYPPSGIEPAKKSVVARTHHHDLYLSPKWLRYLPICPSMFLPHDDFPGYFFVDGKICPQSAPKSQSAMFYGGLVRPGFALVFSGFLHQRNPVKRSVCSPQVPERYVLRWLGRSGFCFRPKFWCILSWRVRVLRKRPPMLRYLLAKDIIQFGTNTISTFKTN